MVESVDVPRYVLVDHDAEQKTRIERVTIPEAVKIDLGKGVERYLNLIREHRPQIVVPLLRSGALAHQAAEGFASRTGIALYFPEQAQTHANSPLVAKINAGREITGRLEEAEAVDTNIPAYEMTRAAWREYLQALAEDEPVREIVGNLAEVIGPRRKAVKDAGDRARVEIVDDWAYELFTQGLQAPWIVLEALRQAGAVDIQDATEELAKSNVLATRVPGEPYALPDIHVPGATIGRSLLLADGAWIDKIRDTSLPGFTNIPDGRLPAQLIKDLMKGGFEDERGRIVPFTGDNWKLVHTRGAQLVQADSGARRRGSRNPADVLDERYKRDDLLQLPTRTATAIYGSLPLTSNLHAV